MGSRWRSGRWAMMSRCDRPPLLTSLQGYQRPWASADIAAGLTLLVIAVPEQLATSRLAGMPPITGFYAFVAGTVLFALLGSNPQMSVGGDSTIAPLFAAGVSALALTGSPRYVDLVPILAVMVGLMVLLVAVLRLGWIAEFLSTPIVSGFLSGVAVIIIAHQLPDFLGLPATSGTNQHRVAYVLTHLNEVNGWSLAIGAGVLALMIVSAARRPPDPRRTDRTGRLRRARRRVRPPGPRRRRVGPGQDGGTPARAHGLVVVDAAEPGATGRRRGAGRRDADGRHDPRLRRARGLRHRRGAGLPRGRRGQRGGGAGGLFPRQCQPAPHRRGGHGGWPDPGWRPGRRRPRRRPHPVCERAEERAPVPRSPPSSIFIALRLFNVRDLVAIARFSNIEFALATVTLLTVVLVGVEQGIGVAVGLAILDRIRVSARPQLHVLGRIPGTTSWQRPDLEPSAEHEPGALVAIFATPIWYANAIRFRDEVHAALLHAPAPVRVFVLDTVGMSDIDFTGTRALSQVLDLFEHEGIAFGVARAGRAPPRQPAPLRPGGTDRGGPLLPDRGRGGDGAGLRTVTPGLSGPTPAGRPLSPCPPPSSSSARTGRWSEPAWGSTAPETGRTAPRTRMWSIWLCGRQEGQVAPVTARRQPGMNRRTSGPQVFMSPTSTALGRASVRNPRRSSAQLRCEPKGRCAMWVPATDIGTPSTVRSTTSAARWTRSARSRRMGTRRVASIGRSGRTSTAIPMVPGSASRRARHRPHAFGQGAHAVHVEGPVLLGPHGPGPPGVGRVRSGPDTPAPTHRVRGDLVAQGAGGLGGLPSTAVPFARPRLLEHDHVGVQRTDGTDVVIGPAPPVHPAVHVVVGDAEHGPPRP